MNRKSYSVLGLDIGGANVKAVALRCRGARIESHTVSSRPFEIWRNRDNLSPVLQEMAAELDPDGFQKVAVTMTAELSDIFRTKREGVLYVLDAVEQAFGKSLIYSFSLDSRMLPLEAARRTPLSCAATNWLASACFLALDHPDCILIDIGSTTTDIIPIRQGKVVSQGRTDPQRLTSGELLYSGMLRTNPNTIVHHVVTGGGSCRVAAENFTSMADVYLILGKISEAEYSCPTADGREKTVENARERLARLICADSEIMTKKEIDRLACYLWEKHLQQITESLAQVLAASHDGADLSLVLAGTGQFLAGEVAERLGIPVLEVENDRFSWPVDVLPAFAVACFLIPDNDWIAL